MVETHKENCKVREKSVQDSLDFAEKSQDRAQNVGGTDATINL